MTQESIAEMENNGADEELSFIQPISESAVDKDQEEISVEERSRSYDLTAAAMGGLVEIVRFHIAHDNHIETYYDAIQLACLMGHLNVIKEFMVRNCPNDFATYSQGRVPLYGARFTGRHEIVTCLLEMGVPDYPQEEYRISPLHSAVINTNAEELQACLADHDVNGTRDTFRRTALHYAAANGHIHCLMVLLEANADVASRDQEGHCPLHCAVAYGRKDAISILLDAGAQIDERTPNGNSALHYAALCQKVSCLKTLLGAKASIEAQNRAGETPLLWAHGNSLRALLDARAAVDTCDTSGNIPLLRAAASGRAADLQLLLDAGSTVSHQNNSGLTPLHCAAYFGHERVLRLLLVAGADVFLRDKDEETALHLAAKNDNQCFDILIHHLEHSHPMKLSFDDKVVTVVPEYYIRHLFPLISGAIDDCGGDAPLELTPLLSKQQWDLIAPNLRNFFILSFLGDTIPGLFGDIRENLDSIFRKEPYTSMTFEERKSLLITAEKLGCTVLKNYALRLFFKKIQQGIPQELLREMAQQGHISRKTFL